MRISKNKVHSSDLVDSQRAIGKDIPFAIEESFRSLYSNILYLPIESKCKKIALTSAFSGEGKTFISINLALTIALNSSESRVLLIDSDMRSPRVHKLLSLKSDNSHGLSEYLAGIDEYPAFSATDYPNLTVLTSGASNVNTVGLLSSGRMKNLIELVSGQFDYVIFDTPPVNIVSDAMLLSDKVDGYVVVTRADYSDVNSVSDALYQLEKVDANVLGFVLCAVAVQGKKYGHYYYASKG
jgi:capsular exopolysaccharide synthesis family protein